MIKRPMHLQSFGLGCVGIVLASVAVPQAEDRVIVMFSAGVRPTIEATWAPPPPSSVVALRTMPLTSTSGAPHKGATTLASTKAIRKFRMKRSPVPFRRPAFPNPNLATTDVSKCAPPCRKSPDLAIGQHCAQARLPNWYSCVVHVSTDRESLVSRSAVKCLQRCKGRSTPSHRLCINTTVGSKSPGRRQVRCQ